MSVLNAVRFGGLVMRSFMVHWGSVVRSFVMNGSGVMRLFMVDWGSVMGSLVVRHSVMQNWSVQ